MNVIWIFSEAYGLLNNLIFEGFIDKVYIEHFGGESKGKCFCPSGSTVEKPSSTDSDTVSERIFLNSSEVQGPRFLCPLHNYNFQCAVLY